MRLPRRGALIAVEGIDGAGKTTLVARFVDAFRSVGIDAMRTKWPAVRSELIRADVSLRDAAEAISLDGTMSDSQKIAAVVAAARGGPA